MDTRALSIAHQIISYLLSLIHIEIYFVLFSYKFRDLYLDFRVNFILDRVEYTVRKKLFKYVNTFSTVIGNAILTFQKGVVL